MFLLLVSLLLSRASGGEIVVATVAQVKNHVITTREVQIHYVLDRLLKHDLYLQDDKDPVEQLIHEWLLYFEAKEFYTTPLSPLTVINKLQKISPQLSGVKGWDKLDVTQSELLEIMKRKMEARRLYAFKKQASILPVADAEVESEYKQHRVRYGTLTLPEVKEKIRQRRTAENLNQRLINWFAVLEKKYRVQRFAKYNQN